MCSREGLSCFYFWVSPFVTNSKLIWMCSREGLSCFYFWVSPFVTNSKLISNLFYRFPILFKIPYTVLKCPGEARMGATHPKTAKPFPRRRRDNLVTKNLSCFECVREKEFHVINFLSLRSIKIRVVREK